jgi:hypothetical protein
MKFLHAHAALPRPESHPAEGFRGLHRKLAMFIGVVICAGICAMMIVRDDRRQRTVARQPPPCTCMGRCLRQRQ